MAHLGEQHGGRGGELGRLQHHGITHGQRRRDLPGQHQQREVPGNDLADNADRAISGKLLVHDLGPAGMVIEVPADQRNVDVAGFANRLAIVETFQHRKQAAVLLDLARHGVQVTRPAVATDRHPLFQRVGRRGNGLVDVRLVAVRDPGQAFSVGRIEGIEVLTRIGLPPLTADEMVQGTVAFLEPVTGPGRRFPAPVRIPSTRTGL